MRFETGKCYQVTLRGEVREFRVIKNDSNGQTVVRYCRSEQADLLSNILMGDISGIEVTEIDGLACDGKPSL